MFGDARIAGQFAEEMLAKDIYVIAFSFPVVPKGKSCTFISTELVKTCIYLETNGKKAMATIDDVTCDVMAVKEQ